MSAPKALPEPVPLPLRLAVVEEAMLFEGVRGRTVWVDLAVTPWHAEAVYRVEDGPARRLFVMALNEDEGVWWAGPLDGDGQTGLFSCGQGELAAYFGSDECYELLEALGDGWWSGDPEYLARLSAAIVLADRGVIDGDGYPAGRVRLEIPAQAGRGEEAKEKE